MNVFNFSLLFTGNLKHVINSLVYRPTAYYMMTYVMFVALPDRLYLRADKLFMQSPSVQVMSIVIETVVILYQSKPLLLIGKFVCLS